METGRSRGRPPPLDSPLVHTLRELRSGRRLSGRKRRAGSLDPFYRRKCRGSERASERPRSRETGTQPGGLRTLPAGVRVQSASSKELNIFCIFNVVKPKEMSSLPSISPNMEARRGEGPDSLPCDFSPGTCSTCLVYTGINPDSLLLDCLWILYSPSHHVDRDLPGAELLSFTTKSLDTQDLLKVICH